MCDFFIDYFNYINPQLFCKIIIIKMRDRGWILNICLYFKCFKLIQS